MSWNLYSEGGLVGQACTNAGWGELQEGLAQVFKLGGYQNLQQFINAGTSDNPKEVQKEIGMLLKSIHNLPTKVGHTLENLQKLLGECEETAIVSE